jgi:hypothetical protein
LPPYVASLGGSVPDGYYVTAGCIVDLGSMLSDDDGLWSVGLTSEDEANWITGGRRTILGPDGKAWTFSNRNIHDPEIVKKALTHLYIEGVADLVDPDRLAEQVKVITQEKDGAIFGLADAARRGDLRHPQKDPDVST